MRPLWHLVYEVPLAFVGGLGLLVAMLVGQALGLDETTWLSACEAVWPST